ncbi:uncharacterized protein An02g14090 [Aspergillus niger]|uniref:Contig An02c0460, genomic contig n=3 Tax=Aspergillus niger TaxID=5061 RepID=A2QFD0_ASPNC|nr:uncharacterized protein An02g14090 [Aspergillus niger]CAK48841.1 unnamed protein product [Aspergillus niger]
MDNEWLSWWKRRQTCAGLVALGGFAEYGVLERENAPDLPECQVAADPNVDKEEPTIPDSEEREELAKRRQTGTGSGKQGMGRDKAATAFPLSKHAALPRRFKRLVLLSIGLRMGDGDRSTCSGDSVISAVANAEKPIIRSIALQRYQRLQALCHPLRRINWGFAFPTLRSVILAETFNQPQRLRTICVGGVSWSAALELDGINVDPYYYALYSNNPFTTPDSDYCLYRRKWSTVLLDIIRCVPFFRLLHPKYESFRLLMDKGLGAA